MNMMILKVLVCQNLVRITKKNIRFQLFMVAKKYILFILFTIKSTIVANLPWKMSREENGMFMQIFSVYVNSLNFFALPFTPSIKLFAFDFRLDLLLLLGLKFLFKFNFYLIIAELKSSNWIIIEFHIFLQFAVTLYSKSMSSKSIWVNQMDKASSLIFSVIPSVSSSENSPKFSSPVSQFEISIPSIPSLPSLPSIPSIPSISSIPWSTECGHGWLQNKLKISLLLKEIRLKIDEKLLQSGFEKKYRQKEHFINYFYFKTNLFINYCNCSLFFLW